MHLALLAARSSPGVTTTTLALAMVLAGQRVVVEACEDGGSLAARFGLSHEPGLTTLAADRTDPSPDLLARHGQPLVDGDERIRVVAGPPSAEAATAVLRAVTGPVTEAIARREDGMSVLVDHGRLSTRPIAAGLLAQADRLVVVARPVLDQLQSVARRLPVLAAFGPPVSVLLVGTAPYTPDQVTASLGCHVAGAVADDPATAAALAGHGRLRRPGRSRLLRSVDALLADLTNHADHDERFDDADPAEIAPTSTRVGGS